MKIAILTHPLGANYGGILQAFALSTYLKREDHEVVVLNRQPNAPLLKRVIKSILVALHHPRYKNPLYKNLVSFVERYINYSQPLFTTSNLTSFIKKNGFDVVIVGSDQVWRRSFSMRYDFNYFLDFVPFGIRKISYAASFGLSEWEYSQWETEQIIQFINEFNSVSVREDKGVALCKNKLNIDAEHVLDPTMLLNDFDYEFITNKRLVEENYIFIYWLGDVEEKRKTIVDLKIQNKTIIDISLRNSESLSSIEDWLSYIKYADYIITDSFHGCIFSILFHKQFTICPNNSGGNGRLYSLLSMLGIDPTKGYINYSLVTDRIEQYREKSCSFIKKSLQ